jgi:lipopolysaccharide transport system permease protein
MNPGMPPAASSPPVETLIRPSPVLPRLNLGEIWHYRELLFFLAWRDIKVRYKQTAIGILWVLLQPLALLLVLSLAFGRFVGASSGSVPYPLFALSGIVPWLFFAASVNQLALSLVQERPLISKIYFPRLILPLAALAVVALEFAIGLALLLVVLLWYGYLPTARWLWLPAVLAGMALLALGVGILLSALTAKYRDFQYAIPFIVQVGLFASPVFYPASVVPEAYRLVYALNPMVGAIGALRWVLTGAGSVDTYSIVAAGVVVVVVLAAGLRYFRSVERTLVDWI